MLVARLCPTLCDAVDSSLPVSSVHGDSPVKNTGVGSNSLLQGSSRPRDQTQVSCIAAILYHLSPQGSPTRGEAVTKPLEQGLIRGRRQTT